MTDRLKADAEFVSQQFNVVATRLGRREETPVGHDQRAGEIIGEPDARQPAGLLAGKAGAIDQRAQFAVERQHGDLRSQLEGALPRSQPRREIERVRLRIVFPLITGGQIVDRLNDEFDAMTLGQIGGERRVHLSNGKLHRLRDGFGRFI